ncbi:MAG: hypothetical protein LBS32_00195 [Clostridiales Family XIII bacterium]|jgi:hypothetical protein|nr:hypothetical protein [Clostridiales Family XIII bacterium]
MKNNENNNGFSQKSAFCGNCGAKIVTGSAFCDGCGKPLAEQGIAAAGIVENTVEAAAATAGRPKKGRKLLVVLCVIFLLIIVGSIFTDDGGDVGGFPKKDAIHLLGLTFEQVEEELGAKIHDIRVYPDGAIDGYVDNLILSFAPDGTLGFVLLSFINVEKKHTALGVKGNDSLDEALGKLKKLGPIWADVYDFRDHGIDRYSGTFSFGLDGIIYDGFFDYADGAIGTISLKIVDY